MSLFDIQIGDSMKNVFISLFFLINTSAVFASNGSLEINIKTNVDVKVSSLLNNVVVQKMENGFLIDQATVESQKLAVIPGVALSKLRSTNFLNVNNYPYIYVHQVKCVFANERMGFCDGSLEIKGHINKISKAQFSFINNTLIINFNFLLSDFDISQRVFLFRINNIAAAKVQLAL